MAFETMHNRLRELQRADDVVKRRWLIVLSSIAMIIVVGFWFLYLNASIPTLVKDKPRAGLGQATSTESVPAPEKSDSFFGILGRGAVNVWTSFIERAELAKREVGARADRLMEFLGRNRELSITATSTQFKPEQ